MKDNKWKEYQSKPIVRKAHEITEFDVLQPIDDSTCELFFDGKTAGSIVFKLYEPAVVGDYVVYLDDTDIYHCRREVFEERNIM